MQTSSATPPMCGKISRHLLPRFAELLEAVLRPEAHQLPALQLRDLLPLRERLRHRLAVHLGQLRLVVERLEVRGPARLIQEDDALGLRRWCSGLTTPRDTAGPAWPAAVSAGENRDRSASAPNPAMPRPRNVRRQMSV